MLIENDASLILVCRYLMCHLSVHRKSVLAIILGIVMKQWMLVVDSRSL